MLPLVLANVEASWVARHPLGNCAVVVAEPQVDGLVCRRWDGLPLG